MFGSSDAFSGFSVDDIDAARQFYGEVLGLSVTDNAMGFLELGLPSGARVLIYPKPEHTPATFTILNFPVADIDATVDELHARGVQTKIYDDAELPTDDKGIVRAWGPPMVWFRDPAGNVLGALETA